MISTPFPPGVDGAAVPADRAPTPEPFRRGSGVTLSSVGASRQLGVTDSDPAVPPSAAGSHPLGAGGQQTRYSARSSGRVVEQPPAPGHPTWYPGHVFVWAAVRAVALGWLVAVLLVVSDGGLAQRARVAPRGTGVVVDLDVVPMPAADGEVGASRHVPALPWAAGREVPSRSSSGGPTQS